MMIRQQLEEREWKQLSNAATLSRNSLGRQQPEEEDEIRTCFMRDRDRIIHSKAFRRLKHKTQVYISPGSDHFRTRLTHTLEVCQISKTIARALGLNEDLIEAIALGHDVGHTPFAHTGEEVLNDLVGQGFRHNQNSVRVLTRIEPKGEGYGLNLTHEVLDGILYHSGYGKEGKHAGTLEGQIIRFSDKIAYVQHDIDDSIRGGIIKGEQLPKQYLDVLGSSHGNRISTLVQDLITHSSELIASSPQPRTVGLSFSEEVDWALKGLRQFMFDEVYRGSICSLERERAALIIYFLFDHYCDYPEKMPLFYQKIVEEEGIQQGVADYISGMSDNYCVELFKEHTIPRSFLKMKF